MVLNTCHITLLPNRWSVQENKTNKELFVLPREMDENAIFGLIHKLREIENNAYKQGVENGNNK